MAVVNFGNSCSWININSDLISEYSSIYETYEIDSEMLEYALMNMNVLILNMIDVKKH